MENIMDARKENLIEFFNDPMYKPMKIREMCAVLQVPRNEKVELKQLLDRLISEGVVFINKQGQYQKVGSDVLKGSFIGNSKGFGFVRVEGLTDDIFIPRDFTNNAFNGDTVSVKITKEALPGKRQEGRVTAILERSKDLIIGTFEKSKDFGFVIPDNDKFGSDIFILSGKSMKAKTGDKVIVEIMNFGDGRRSPEGRIIEILGNIDEPGVDVLSVIKAYKLPEVFPDSVIEEAKSVCKPVTQADYSERRDYRELFTVTIDGETAKDLDDAVTLSFDGEMYHLGVHIADVTHYVTEGSELDKEAIRRGTSVYLTDRVLPMLPKELSNGICSLNEKEDRLALSCMMDMDKDGNILSHEITESVINVNHRMSYTVVNDILVNPDSEYKAVYSDSIELFETMRELSKILREKRRIRGGISFEFPEPEVLFDEKGYVKEIRNHERNDATELIEDFMLAANETVAEDYFWQELPFLYRIHETPDNDSIKKMMTIIRGLGYYIKAGNNDIHPKELQKLLGKVQGEPCEAMVQKLVLKSLKRAKYSTENAGHFGLAAKYYCHFTSPIRRYPDLQIHRIIKENLRGKFDDRRYEHYNEILPEIALSTSTLERRADDAERDVDKLKMVEYMSNHLGEEYEGTISYLTNFGIYVELENSCEGMVSIRDLDDDYYEYDQNHFCLVGRGTLKKYELGMKVNIRVVGASKATKTIDFVLVDKEVNRRYGKRRTKSGRK